jgi:hypothetical protein
MSVRNLIIFVSRFFGFYPSKLSENGIKAILELLRPLDNGHKLIRIGGTKDGGYLLPDDLIGVEACFSAGVASNWSFENDLFQNFTIPSIMYDASVDRPAGLPDVHIFYKKFIGASSFRNYTSVTDVVSIDLEKYVGDLIGQIDIEGGEYPLLNSISLETLLRFRVLVIELHELIDGLKSDFFKKQYHPS